MAKNYSTYDPLLRKYLLPDQSDPTEIIGEPPVQGMATNPNTQPTPAPDQAIPASGTQTYTPPAVSALKKSTSAPDNSNEEDDSDEEDDTPDNISRADLIQKIRNNVGENLPDFERYKAANDAQMNLIKAVTGLPTQTDYSPLMALTDSWFGTNLQKGYKAPQTPEQRAELIAGLQKNLAQSEHGLTENQNSQLRDLLTFEKPQMAGLTKEESLMLRAEQGVHKNPIILSNQGTLNQIQKDRSLLASGHNVTENILSEVENGMANIISGKNNTAQEQINAQKVKSVQRDLNKNKSYYLNKPFDALPPAWKDVFMMSFDRLEESARKNQDSEARRISSNSQGYSPRVGNAMHTAASQYFLTPDEVKKYAKNTAPQKEYAPDVQKYAQDNKVTLDEAQAFKDNFKKANQPPVASQLKPQPQVAGE